MQACPTATLQEKSVKAIGKPERAVVTTCAYCGVGCTFRAEMRGEQLVRMVPWKDGKANRGHSCVKGRFAYGYANHKDRILDADDPRQSIDQPWREVSWDEAIEFSADRLNAIKAEYGADARSAASPRAAAPTRRPSSSRSWSAPRSAPTTSIPARACATRRPATASRPRSAPAPARRTSIR